MASNGREVGLLLRMVGLVELLAAGAMVMPRRWMAAIHAGLGMGVLPEGPIVGYLARLTSLLYALLGAVLLFVSFDVNRYGRLIAFLGMLTILHGVAVVGIGLAEDMPLWWTIGDGLALIGTGIVVLVLQRTGGAKPSVRGG